VRTLYTTVVLQSYFTWWVEIEMKMYNKPNFIKRGSLLDPVLLFAASVSVLASSSEFFG